jgi:phosphatidylglycerophosphate synthase
MDVELAIRWTKGVVICAVAIWEVVQLTRRRDDLALRVLAPGLVLLAIAATFGIRTPVLEPIKDFFGPTVWGHIINGCWMAMAYCWAAYFLLANTDKPAAWRKRKALIELSFLVVALIVMVVTKEIAPDGIRRPAANPERYHDWERSAWYLAISGYALTAWFVGVRRAMVMRRKLRHPWARAAFWIVIVGSAAMTLGVDAVVLVRQAGRQFDTSFDPDFLTVAYSTGQLSGQFVLALGLALAPLATIFVRLRARYEHWLRARYNRRTLPLWRALTAEFPYVVLDGVSTGRREDDFERITTEITDGLSELARDCPQPDGDARDPRVAAEAIATGLARRAEQRQAQWAGDEVSQAEPPYPRIEPDFPDWRRRAQWMAAVADELRTRGVIGKDEHARASAG